MRRQISGIACYWATLTQWTTRRALIGCSRYHVIICWTWEWACAFHWTWFGRCSSCRRRLLWCLVFNLICIGHRFFLFACSWLWFWFSFWLLAVFCATVFKPYLRKVRYPISINNICIRKLRLFSYFTQGRVLLNQFFFGSLLSRNVCFSNPLSW